MKQPSIGRIVHVVEHGVHWPAIITRIDQGGRCWLAVFGDAGCFASVESVAQDPNGAEGTWHWPEYVPDEVPPARAAADLPEDEHTLVAAGDVFVVRTTKDLVRLSITEDDCEPLYSFLRPDQARTLAALLLREAAKAEAQR